MILDDAFLHLLMACGASNWFEELHEHEQRAYLAAHPHSKYAGGAGGDERLPFGHQVPKKTYDRHARILGAKVIARDNPNLKTWRDTIARAGAATTKAERERLVGEADALHANAGGGGGKTSVEEKPEPPSMKDEPALVDPVARTKDKLPSGAKIAHNGIEMRPIEHPRSYEVSPDGMHNIGGKMMTAHSYELHKNGQRIGTVHSAHATIGHKIPNSRLMSHTSHHRVYKLNIDAKHLRPGSYVGGSYGSLKEAITRAGDSTHGENVLKKTARMENVDHAAHAEAHERAAHAFERLADQHKYASRKSDPYGHKQYEKYNSARWAHDDAAKRHHRAMDPQNADRADDLVRQAVEATSYAKRKSTAMGHPFEVRSTPKEAPASEPKAEVQAPSATTVDAVPSKKGTTSTGRFGSGEHGDTPTHELRAKYDQLKTELLEHHMHHSIAPMRFNKRYPELISMEKALKKRKERSAPKETPASEPKAEVERPAERDYFSEHMHDALRHVELPREKKQQIFDAIRDKHNVDFLRLSDEHGINAGQAKQINEARKEYRRMNAPSKPTSRAERIDSFLKQKHIGPIRR